MTKAWLRDLEERVEGAADTIRELRSAKSELETRAGQLEEDNARLESQVETLQTQLGEAESRAAEAGQDDGSSEWQEERDEIRQRVEKLVDHLGGLLDEE